MVLADTGPLYAVRDPSDQKHSRAQEDRDHFEVQNLKVVVPYPILLESYSLVMYKLGLYDAQNYLEEVISTVILENATLGDYRKAHARIMRYRDQDISLFDAVLAEVSDRIEAPIWTFDSHFDTMRANVWR